MSKRTRATVAFVLVIMLWGATFVVVKEALGSASVFVFIAIRFGMAAVVMAAMYRSAVRGVSREEISAGLQIGFFLFVGYALQSTGLLFTTASKSAFITGSAVVLVPVALYAFWRQRVHGGAWWGAAAALAGVFFISVPVGGLGSLRQVNPGDLLTMGGAAMFAMHIVLNARYREHSVGALSFMQVAVTAVLSAVAIPVFHFSTWEVARLNWSAGLVAALIVTGVFGTAIAFSVQVWSQRHMSPTHTGLLLTLEPVFAAITSYIVLQERLGGRALLGSALILTGILVAELKGPAQAAVEAPGPVTPPANFAG